MRTPDAYLDIAIAYAARRWLLDDAEIVREWCDRSRNYHARPEDLVDAYAEKYGLDDPSGPWGVLS